LELNDTPNAIGCKTDLLFCRALLHVILKCSFANEPDVWGPFYITGMFTGAYKTDLLFCRALLHVISKCCFAYKPDVWRALLY